MSVNNSNIQPVKQTNRQESFPEATLAGYIPLNNNQSKAHRRGKSATRNFIEKNPQWEGAPVSVEAVKENLHRCKRMAAFESLDFDPIDSDLERQRDLQRAHSEYAQIQFWKWFLCLMIGIIMGMLAFLVDWGIETINNFKYGLVYKLITPGGSFWQPFLVYMAMILVFAFIAGSMVSFVSPLAAGSGIPELKTFLNGIQIRGLLKMKTLVSKLGGVIFSITAGLIAGKEGPFVHGGGIVGGGIGAMGSKTLRFKLPTKIGGYFRGYAEHRDFVAIGTAAGVAVAFSAPIGGLLFTIEEGASFYSVSVFWRGILATCVGVGTLSYFAVEKNPNLDILQKLGGNRDFGLYSDGLADYGDVYHYYLWEIPLFILMGVGGGLLGAGFVWMNVQVTKFRSKYIRETARIKRLLEVMLIAAVTAVIFFVISYVSPCEPLPSTQIVQNINVTKEPARYRQDEQFYQWGGKTNHFPQLWCPEGEYSLFGQLFFVPLASGLRLVIHMGERLKESYNWEFSEYPLLAYFAVTYILMTWTYGAGAPTGLFVPSLSIGATLGRIIGKYMKIWIHKMSWKVAISVPTYAIIGASASLGGATRMTLSITVLVMETTGALELITPIMITVFFAKITGDFFGCGIYDTHIHLRGTPILDEFQLEAHQKMLQDKLQVGDIADSRVVAVSPVSSLRMVVDALTGCMHGTIPVTRELTHTPGKAPVAAEEFYLEGVLQRGQVIKILKYRLSFYQADEIDFILSEGESRTVVEAQELLEKLEQIPMRTHQAELDAAINQFSSDELDKYHIDFRPIMRRHPYVVREDAPVSRAYRLFRTMGLRQLFVSSIPKVKSVVTRKDLVEDNLMLALGEKAHAGSVQMTRQQSRRLQKSQSSRIPVLSFELYHSEVEQSFAHAERMAAKPGHFLTELEALEEDSIVDNSNEEEASTQYNDSPSTPFLQQSK